MKQLLKRLGDIHVIAVWYLRDLLLSFILLMWTFGRAPNNASKWQMGFNSVA